MLQNIDYTLPLDNLRRSMVQGTQLKLIWLPCNTFTNILIVSVIMNYRRRSEKEALIQLMIPVDSLLG